MHLKSDSLSTPWRERIGFDKRVELKKVLIRVKTRRRREEEEASTKMRRTDTYSFVVLKLRKIADEWSAADFMREEKEGIERVRVEGKASRFRRESIRFVPSRYLRFGPVLPGKEERKKGQFSE